MGDSVRHARVQIEIQHTNASIRLTSDFASVLITDAPSSGVSLCFFDTRIYTFAPSNHLYSNSLDDVYVTPVLSSLLNLF